MQHQSALPPAVTTITRTSTVAAGVFAPGHLGELTPIVPFELVDAVLEDACAAGRRTRDLPSRVGVYFLLAMCLFSDVGYKSVWAKLTCGLGGLDVPEPSEKALRDLRRRLGPAPAKALFEVLAGPLAQPCTRGVRFGGFRTVSFDGCASQKAPDGGRNRAWLGKDPGAGYPRLELMTLVETGTRALLGAVFGPPAEGETDYARRLLHLLDETVLVLWDRGFDGDDFLAEVAATRAQFLGRVKANRRPPVLARLPDGSFRSRIGGVDVRVVEAAVTVTCADGTRYRGAYRLAATLLDHRRHPAHALVELYHERWEHEIAYLALRHTVLDGRVLRSRDPAGIEQEMWALLALYQVLRTAMVDAAESRPGTDPDRVSFKVAFQAARDQVVTAAGVVPDGADLVGEIGRRVLADLLPARRPRVVARKVKSPLSRYAKSDDGRPAASQNVTELDIAVCEPAAPSEDDRRQSSGGDPSPPGDVPRPRGRQLRQERSGTLLTAVAEP